MNQGNQEFDIVKISEFLIATKDILEGNLDVNLKDDLKLFKEFTSSSNKFVNYINDLEKNKFRSFTFISSCRIYPVTCLSTT